MAEGLGRVRPHLARGSNRGDIQGFVLRVDRIDARILDAHDGVVLATHFDRPVRRPHGDQPVAPLMVPAGFLSLDEARNQQGDPDDANDHVSQIRLLGIEPHIWPHGPPPTPGGSTRS